MLPPAPHYEPYRDHLSQGDIGYFPFSQLLRADESAILPGGVMPPTVRRVPVFEGARDSSVMIGERAYLLRSWHGLGLVVDVTSELFNQPDDGRVTIAPLVPPDASGLHWPTAAAGRYAGVLPLPSAAQNSVEDGIPERDWPDLVVLPRSMCTISRGLANDGRMMTLAPRMAAVLAVKLGEFFGERHWARSAHFNDAKGHTLVEVLEIDKADGPGDGKWVVLTFSNGERKQVFVSAAN